MERWMQEKQERIRIFEDTERWYKSDPILQARIKDSIERTVFYPDGAEIKPKEKSAAVKVSVIKDRSFQAAFNYLQSNPCAKVCVHNFASATHPGGGVRNGSTAQEEALCRCSTLLPCLTTDDLYRKYYEFHRKRRDTYYTDAIIYTPDVYVIKSDTAFPERLKPEEWIKADVLTCAAPNLRSPDGRTPVKIDTKAFTELHVRRAEKIIKAASANGAEILITGAFGCGAFKNPPELVANAWRTAIKENKSVLREIIFAVYCTPRNESNYWAFKGALSR